MYLQDPLAKKSSIYLFARKSQQKIATHKQACIIFWLQATRDEKVRFPFSCPRILSLFDNNRIILIASYWDIDGGADRNIDVMINNNADIVSFL